MIDIRNGELADLWPDETSPEFKSISYALRMAIIRMLEKAAGVGSSCDIDHLAESTLDYLAVEMRAMYYDQGADIETKRSRNERGSSRRTGYRDLRSEYHSRRRPGYGRSIYHKRNRHRRKHLRPE